jgi:hypothetical protein
MAARAASPAGHVPVRRNLAGGNPAHCAEVSEQATERGQLPGRRRSLIEVPHEADADAVLVEVIVGRLAVSPMFLFVPPRPDFDTPLRRIRSVSDHEVVTQFVPTVVLPVVLVKPLGSASVRAAVVNHDARPARTQTRGLWIPQPRGGIPLGKRPLCSSRPRPRSRLAHRATGAALERVVRIRRQGRLHAAFRRARTSEREQNGGRDGQFSHAVRSLRPQAVPQRRLDFPREDAIGSHGAGARSGRQPVVGAMLDASGRRPHLIIGAGLSSEGERASSARTSVPAVVSRAYISAYEATRVKPNGA